MTHKLVATVFCVEESFDVGLSSFISDSGKPVIHEESSLKTFREKQDDEMITLNIHSPLIASTPKKSIVLRDQERLWTAGEAVVEGDAEVDNEPLCEPGPSIVHWGIVPYEELRSTYRDADVLRSIVSHPNNERARMFDCFVAILNIFSSDKNRSPCLNSVLF